MIRRLFWLALGAVLGVTGYRKATAVARSLRPAPRPSGLAGFAADVREGMALYMERQSRPSASTLEGHRRPALPTGRPAPGEPHHQPAPGGRRSPAAAGGQHRRAAHHRDEPKDGH